MRHRRQPPTTASAPAAVRLGRPFWLTRAGMVAEEAARAFWPLWSLLLLALAALALGFHDTAAAELFWVLGALWAAAVLAAAGFGLYRFRWPSAGAAVARLDATLPGRPIATLADRQAIGAGDAASEAVWQAHLARMAARLRQVRPVRPDLRLAARDPYALRYAALGALVVALLFGSLWRVASVGDVVLRPGSAAAAGPSWEGWIEPPTYTGRPTLYLNDIPEGPLEVEAGSRLILRFYGQLGRIAVRETVGAAGPDGTAGAEAGIDATENAAPAADAVPTAATGYETVIARSGQIAVEGPGGRSWEVRLIPDAPPEVAMIAPVEILSGGEMRQPFEAIDDYAVDAGKAVIRLDLPAVDRRYGLAAEPDPREPVVVDLPMPITGDRADFTEVLVERFPDHPWSGLPVTLQLEVADALGQIGQSLPQEMTMPGRRFFDPMAAAVAEQRRDILWSLTNVPRAARVLRAVSNRPEGFIKNEKAYLLLRIAIRRLEAARRTDQRAARQDELADILWRVALLFEEGDLSSALERLRRAQDRLSQAMREGATDDEIAQLMQEMREAMQDYMRELAEQSRRDGPQQAENQNMQEMTGDQLQQMLDRLQQLMQEGRMAEAQQLLEQLRRMMENMRVTEGQPGQQSQGQQAMEGLADSLRRQQGLNDEAFQSLQDQFGTGQRPGEGQGEPQGRGQQGQGQGQGEGQGQRQGGNGPQGAPGTRQGLADRQGELRDELERQRQDLPRLPGPEGDAAADALGRAGEAMDRAERALRDDALADALDSQSEAMEALREGIRNLGEAMAQRNESGQGDRAGGAQGTAGRSGTDPLGRRSGEGGALGSDGGLTEREDVYRRARDLLDEIRRRSGEQSRPDAELDYLRRLLEQF